MKEIKKLLDPFLKKGYIVSIHADLPYLMTDNWWDQPKVFDKETMTNMCTRLKKYTSGDTVVRFWCAHQQVNPLRKRLQSDSSFSVAKNPYMWVYPKYFYQVCFFLCKVFSELTFFL